jgi:hypothetical protein
MPIKSAIDMHISQMIVECVKDELTKDAYYAYSDHSSGESLCMGIDEIMAITAKQQNLSSLNHVPCLHRTFWYSLSA